MTTVNGDSFRLAVEIDTPSFRNEETGHERSRAAMPWVPIRRALFSRRGLQIVAGAWICFGEAWRPVCAAVPPDGMAVPLATVSASDVVPTILEGSTLPPTDGPGGLATTVVGGGTFDINAFLGATRYYGNVTPITGQNTITTNLEAGHVWNGHEALAHVTTFTQGGANWGGGAVAPLYDRHATWVGLLIGGRQTSVNPAIRQQGIAHGTDLRSAAIATNWSGAAYASSFDINPVTTLIPAYAASFGTADVINSSFGGTDPAGVGSLARLADAYSFNNSRTTYVAAAGNTGPAANSVGAPGSGYNQITVAALGDANGFDSAASFSSRGPQDFGFWITGSTGLVFLGVRAAVDIAAPGASLTSGFYGGQTGGNNTSLVGSVNDGTSPAAYSDTLAGTSFAAPIVAGGAALVASAAKTLAPLASNPNARESMVVKSLLLTGADKTSGWSNGQQNVTVSGTTFLQTTQSLDWAVGAGRMNLDKTFDIQVNGQADVSGSTGLLGTVARRGWDFGSAVRGTHNDYLIGSELTGSSTFTATLSWMRNRGLSGLTLLENAQADLDLSIWSIDANGAFTKLVARLASDFNTVEHLSFTLPATGRYGMRVEYAGNTFDNTPGAAWGSAAFPQTYGLAWTSVPEPAALVLVGAGAGLAIAARMTARRRGTATVALTPPLAAPGCRPAPPATR